MASSSPGDYRLLKAANPDHNRTASLTPNYHGILCPGCGSEAGFGESPQIESVLVKFMVLHAARFSCPVCGEDEVYLQERILHAESQ